jgi:hypothetical protein
MKRYSYVIPIFVFIVFSSHRNRLDKNYHFQGSISPKEIIDLSYLKQKSELLFFNWNQAQKTGAGVLNNDYVIQSSSWLNESEYGVKMVCLTTNAKKEILGNEDKASEYVLYLEKEIISLSRLLLKDKEAVKAIESGISSRKGKFNIDKGTYVLITDTERYTEVSAQVLHFDFHSDLITVTCRVVN